MMPSRQDVTESSMLVFCCFTTMHQFTCRVLPRLHCECRFEELNHPPYSSDLAPSDYFLFQHLKKHLRGCHFPINNNIQATVNNWLEGELLNFFPKGLPCCQQSGAGASHQGGAILKNNSGPMILGQRHHTQVDNLLHAHLEHKY